MDAKDFVNSLKRIPCKDHAKEFEQMGLPQDFVIEYFESYLFKQKKSNVFENLDPIIDLVNNFDGSTVKIGMITFDIDSYQNGTHFIFGRFEVDLLGINNKTGKVELLDYEDVRHKVSSCSKDSSSFLKAVLKAAIFIEKLPHNEDISSNQEVICKAASECSNLAGGSKYLNFYQLLVGCDK